jgi:hypothetical protein
VVVTETKHMCFRSAKHNDSGLLSGYLGRNTKDGIFYLKELKIRIEIPPASSSWRKAPVLVDELKTSKGKNFYAQESPV